MPSLVASPTCHLDELLVGFVQDCRRQTQSEAIYQMLGPRHVDVQSLFRDQGSQTVRSPHAITDLIRNVLDVAGVTRLLERIAIFAPLHSVISWLAHPISETRGRISHDYAPCEQQLTVPHPQWVDLIQWVGLRKVTIDQQDAYATEEFQRAYFGALRLVNWPFDPLQSLVTDPQTGRTILTEAFLAHVVNGANWCLDASFVQRYPELNGYIQVEQARMA